MTDTYSDDTERCETEGCHRQTSMVMRYAVWDSDGDRYPTRRVCQPCANAMLFRESFDSGSDAWSLQPGTQHSGESQ